jgi:hypothetical protein
MKNKLKRFLMRLKSCFCPERVTDSGSSTVMSIKVSQSSVKLQAKVYGGGGCSGGSGGAYAASAGGAGGGGSGQILVTYGGTGTSTSYLTQKQIHELTWDNGL